MTTKFLCDFKVGLLTLFGLSVFLTVYYMKYLSEEQLDEQDLLTQRAPTYLRPVHDIEQEWNNTVQAAVQHVEYFLNVSRVRGLQSRLGNLKHECASTSASLETEAKQNLSPSSLCSNELWTRRKADPESVDYLDYAMCTPYVTSNISTVDCIESKRFPRNCALSHHRFCKGTNMIFTRSRRWQFYDPSGHHPERIRYCLGTEINGGDDAPMSILPASNNKCNRKINRTTFYFGRYVTHDPNHRYQVYHSIHGGVASLFATIMETDPTLLDQKTMKMQRQKVQIMLLNRAPNWDDPVTPEMIILNMMSDAPIMYEEDIAQGDIICFDTVVTGLSNRVYIERRDISMAYSVIKRRYMKLFRQFVLSNLPNLTDAEYSIHPYLRPRQEDEPLVLFTRRMAGDIVVGRSAFNENEIASYLTDPKRYKYAKYVHIVDFMKMSGLQQLHALSKPSTIFTGMFGASFVHLYWMNPQASTAIMWRNEALRNRIYHVISDLVEVRLLELLIHRDQCSYSPEHIEKEFENDFERRKTIEFFEPDSHKGFEYTRDLTCFLDMEKVELLITSAVERVFKFYQCRKEKEYKRS